MQLYVDRNRPKTEKLLGVINGFEGMKGIFVTVDAAAPGKREADERSRAEIEVVSWRFHHQSLDWLFLVSEILFLGHQPSEP
jgi:hypothetical protein